jgi:hypothetical protein
MAPFFFFQSMPDRFNGLLVAAAAGPMPGASRGRLVGL